jgi:hypothetical protein
MRKSIVTAGLLVMAAKGAAQTVIQGDSLYRGLQVGNATQAQVVAQLGAEYKATKIKGRYAAKLRSGEGVSGTFVRTLAYYYPQLRMTCYVDNADKHLQRMVFDASSAVVSMRGIRPGEAQFADVVARYGSVSEERQGSHDQPYIWEYALGQRHWYTVLVYPHISFVSKGQRRTGEDLMQRQVDQIWLQE